MDMSESCGIMGGRCQMQGGEREVDNCGCGAFVVRDVLDLKLG